MSWLDLSDVQEKKFVPIHPGRYMMVASDASVRPTRDGTGEFVSVKFTIIEGECEGKTIYNNFNIKNKSEKAQAAGRSQLKAFLTAAGVTNYSLNSVSEINGIIVVGIVKIKKDPEYGDKPVVAYFEKVDDTPDKSSGAPFTF